MRTRVSIAILAVLFTCFAFAEDVPKLDAANYPQDTPEHALSTVVKVIESENFGYWITWIITPDSTQRTLEKFKTLEAAIADSKTSEAKITGRKKLLEGIITAQKNKKTAEGDEKGVKWFRFMTSDTEFVQFEKQADNRWCMNPRARTETK